MSALHRSLAPLLAGALAIACHGRAVTTSSTHTSSGAGGQSPTCAASDAQGIEIASLTAIDPAQALGYPPYAVDGCDLVYVAPGQAPSGAGELRLRSLATGSERVLADAAATPSRPAISGTVVAWEATVNGKRAVQVLDVALPSALPVTVTGPFDHAGEPRVSGGSVAFTAWLGPADTSDTDVYVHDVATGAVTAVATGAGQQRFADISPTHVAWSDFSVGPSGIFADQAGDAANIVVADRATGAVTRRTKPGKQAFPMLGVAGKIAYLDWGLVHPEPKFSEYDLRLGDVSALGGADVLVAHVQTNVYLRPIASGAYLEWIATAASGAPQLLRSGVDVAFPAVTVESFGGQTVIGPSAGGAITLVGATAPNMPSRLQAFAR